MRRGFTLLEMLMAIGIFMILIGITFTALNTSNVSWDAHNVRLDVQQEARRGVEAVASDLYQTASGQISVTSGNTVITFKVPVVVGGDTDIYDASGNINWGADASTANSIRYSRNAATSQLIREIVDGAGNTISSRVAANFVNTVLFDPQPAAPSQPTALIINITCQKPLRPGAATNITQSLQSRITFRN